MIKPKQKAIAILSLAHSVLTKLVVAFFFVALTGVFLYTRVSTPVRVSAAVPATLNFQSRLLNASGSIVPDGTYNVEFKIFNALTSSGSAQGSCAGDATCLWTETRLTTDATNLKVTLRGGYMSVYLGDKTALPSNIWDQQLYLSMNIGGTPVSPTWDGEMSPRLRLTSVPYAFQAAKAGQLQQIQGSFTGTVDFGTLTADRKYLFPDTSLATTASPGTICVYNGAGSNCPAASGSAYYIQNDTVLQTQSNFNIQARDSTTNGTIAAQLRGAAGGQTVDLLQVQNTSGVVLTSLTANGSLQFTPTSGRTISVSQQTGTNVGSGLTINAGQGGSGGAAGGILGLAGGAAGGTNQNGGNLTIDGGTATGTGTKGSVVLQGTGGNVGIGLPNPSQALTLGSSSNLGFDNGSGTADIVFQRTGARALKIEPATTGAAGTSLSIDLSGNNTNANSLSTTLNINGSANNGTDKLTFRAYRGNPPVISSDGDLQIAANTSTAGNGILLGVNNGVIANNRVGINTLSPTAALQVAATNGIAGATGTAGTAGFTVTGGSGGNSSGATTAGGAGGAISLTSGAGGNSTGVAGTNGANISLQGGAGGTGTATGNYGNILLNSTGGNVGIGTATPTGALSFGGDVARTIKVEANSANAAGNGLTISAGAAGAGAAAFTGGTLTLQGGAAGGTGNANGANVAIQGGAGTGSGVQGLVTLASSAYTASATETSAITFTLAQSKVDNSSTIPVNATAASLTVTVPAPTQNVVGRLLYITAVNGSNTFTLAPSGGTSFTMNANTTATLIWNGNVWTNAGVDGGSSSYIQNQNGSTQTANFLINGTGQANTKFLSPLFDVASAGTFSLGTGTATAITIGKAAVTTTNAGALTVTQVGTFNGGLAVATGSTFTNASSTLLTAIAIANLATGGNIGTAAATVDVATTFTINQTTAAQTVTIPSPTVTTAGRLIYIANIGTASFTMLGATISTGTTATLIWNGTAWTFAGADASSVLNQNTSAQTANFQISGTGQANTGFTAPLIKSLDSVGGGNGANLVVQSGAAISGNGNVGGNLTLKTGDAVAGNTRGSGSITIDSGTSQGGAATGTIVIGTANASAITIGKVGVLTSLQGNTTLGASAGSGTVLTNNGATVNSTLALGNFATGGAIGTAAATVDIYTSVSVAQTTASQTLTIPTPTTNTTYGRLLYISNIGTTGFTLLGSTLNAGATATIIWANTNGAASWQYAGADGNAVVNQNTIDQTANFRISGTGRANTSFITPLVDAVSASLGIGTTAASTTALSLGNTSSSFSAESNATANLFNGATAHTIALGTGAAVQGITIGSTNTTSATTIQGGNGSTAINLQATSGGSINIGTTNNNAIVIPGTLTGTINTSTYLCRNSFNQITTCLTTGTGAAFVQGGNAFGALASLGTTDANDLAFVTGGTERWRITTTGVLQSNGAQTIQTTTGNLTIATAAGNGNILLSPNGTGRVGIGLSGAPAALLSVGGSTGNFQVNTNGSLTIAQAAVAGGQTALKVIAGAHTAVIAEAIDLQVVAHTNTITGGYATQRFSLFEQPTITAGSALTVTNSATVAIAGAPIKAGSALLTNTYGLLVQSGAVGAATNSYGLGVNAQTGATNNYAATFLGGNVGIGTAAPTATLNIVGPNSAVTNGAAVTALQVTGGTGGVGDNDALGGGGLCGFPACNGGLGSAINLTGGTGGVGGNTFDVSLNNADGGSGGNISLQSGAGGAAGTGGVGGTGSVGAYGNILLNVSGGNVGIGTVSPTAKLHVSSAVASQALFRVTDATATAADVLNIADEGATTFKNRTNSTTAFQVQNAAGTSIFNVDSTNAKIGTAPTTGASTNSAVLTIGSGNASGTTSNSGNVVIDSGTATGTAGNISIGTGAYAHNTTIGNATGATTVVINTGSGGIALNGATNVNSTLSVGGIGGNTGAVLGDLIVNRSTTGGCTVAPGCGAIFFGNSAGAHYQLFNGSYFQITDPLVISGASSYLNVQGTSPSTISGSLAVGVAAAAAATVRLEAVGATNISTQTGQLGVTDSISAAAGVGGLINFRGNYTGTSPTEFAAIQGFKENGVAGDYGGALSFLTRANGSSYSERLRISSTGNVGIGVVSPTAALQVQSANGTSGVTGTAGVSSLVVATGNGGNSSGASTAGGAGGAISLTAGNGGNSTGVAGTNGGSISLQGGAGGTGTLAGNYGPIVLQQNGGNVGIGTNAPFGKLSFGNFVSVPDVIYYDGGNTNRYGTGIQPNELQSFVPSGGHFSFNAGGDIQASGTNELIRIQGDGKVGIGTPSPSAKLQVNGGSLLVTGTYGGGNGITTTGTGTRMFFDTNKAAFRAGRAINTAWDPTNVGDFSVAFGDTNIASGISSISAGLGNTASGDYSVALGISSSSGGARSVAIGDNALAGGLSSISLGAYGTATGDYSSSLGYNSTAQSYASTVVGSYNVIQGTSNSWVATDDLFVVGNGTSAASRSNAFDILKNGNVGIGTSAPVATFDARGTAQFRNLTDSSSAFMVQNAAGASSLTIDTTNTSAGLNIAVNNGGETGGTPPTGWSAVTGTVTPTITQTTTTGEYASGKAGIKVAIGAGTGGVKNTFGTAAAISTTYNASFSVKSSSGTPTLSVLFSPDGTATLPCTAGAYASSSITLSFVKYSCKFTSAATPAITANAYLSISQTDSTARNLYIDNLSLVPQNSAGTQNAGVLKVGGASGQGLTLFQLDTSAGTPFTGGNQVLAGAMYFDTTAGKMQCYDGTVWGACGAAPNSNITLTPEYAGAVLNGKNGEYGAGTDKNIGTLTSDFCGNGGGLSVNTGFCASGEARNFYSWTTTQPSYQSYSAYVTYKLPSTFKAFVGNAQLYGRVDNTTNAGVNYSVYRSTGSGITQCGGGSTPTNIVGWDKTAANGSANTWTPATINPATSCSFAANDYVIFKIDVVGKTSANAYVENLNFSFSNQ